MAERGMGRGLSAILSVSAPPAGSDGASTELRELAVDLIKPNKDQPRRQFDEATLQALAESVQERGVIQPVLVRPRAGGSFELVAGERRWRAAKLAGLERMPALVQDHDDAATLEVALVENMAREDLNPVEEARAVAGLVEELGLTREAVGKKVGRSRVAISNLLRILDLPDDALALLEDGTLTEGHGRALLLAEDQADRRRLARAAADGAWSVRVTEDQARAANDAATRTSGKASPKAVHPDQAAAASEIADALGGALGIELKVKPRGTGYKVELALDSLDDALALAQRVRAGG
ncbi:putative chromosome-partitioning protein ParB [Baekduia alba]|uniref:ParB/RepB/Spo0J family partition protein n=1 Tax=Baekduia alba TaxID=2997333 RepID=UPI002340C756|nr:ParB/RepB/Spo0J family partition protein [Baekduia alba]WCB97084.1 putative chromosome-partitioning protein ParB [Baekduia alba]